MVNAIATLLLCQQVGQPILEGKILKDPYRMVFDVKVETKSYKVELSPLSGDSYVKAVSQSREPLDLGSLRFLPKEGFLVDGGLSSDYTLGMDFLADKLVAVDFRDGSFCIWSTDLQNEARRWFMVRVGNNTSGIEVIKGTRNEMGISLNCRTDHGQSSALVSLGAYGSTLSEQLKGGLEEKLVGRPGFLSNSIEIEQRKVRWPWFLSKTKSTEEQSPSAGVSVIALSTLKSRVVGLDFSRAEILCESSSEDDQIAFTLQEAFRVPFQIKGDDILLGGRSSQENKYIESIAGSKVRRLNDVKAEAALALLRDSKRARIRDVAQLLFGGLESQLEIEKPNGEVLEITLTRG